MTPLCALCTELTTQPLSTAWKFNHHRRYATLISSARGGCQFCQLVWKIIVNSHTLNPWGDTEVQLLEKEKLYFSTEGYAEDRSKEIAIEFSNSLVSVDKRFCPVTTASRGVRIQALSYGVRREAILSIHVSKDSEAHTIGNVAGAELNQEASIDLARSWLKECQISHPACTIDSVTDLPTRILDLSSVNVDQRVRLLLSDGIEGPYVSLSHRWGNTRPFCLTKDSFQQLLTGVTIDTLPLTFRDAIKVTRELGYGYIGIDSLCIFQDSEEDWARECIKMPLVYKNAQLNIASACAFNTEQGFLKPREFAITNDIELPWTLDGNMSKELIRLAYSKNQGDFSPGPDSDSALVPRGWVVQERILCRRMLHFEKRRLYWECRTNTSREDSHFPCRYSANHQHSVIEKFPLDVSNTPNFWLTNWYRLVTSYSHTNLTYEKDRFPAISALAQEFGKSLGDEYVAGLWKRDILRGMVWIPFNHSARIRKTTESNRREPYVAPTWSWASVRAPIQFVFPPFHSGTLKWDAEFIRVSVLPATDDSFGRISGANLELEARTFTIAFTRVHNSWEVNLPGNFSLKYVGDDNEEFYVYASLQQPLAGSNTGKSAGPTQVKILTFLYLGLFEPTVGSAKHFAIAVSESSQDVGCYQRLGGMKVEGLSLNFESVFKFSERKVFKLV